MASFKGDSPTAITLTALSDRKELALVAVERTRMPMVVTDPRQPDSPIVLANRAFLDLTRYTSEEVLGRNCRFLQGPDTSAADVDVVRYGLAGRSDHVSVELLNYRKDGSTFWNQLSISPVVDEAGEVIYHFGSQKDVTARRRVEQLEATERLLLMEIDHRAANALALVKSIVRRSRAGTGADYSSSILGRVDSLARAHRLLAKSAWVGADLQQIVEGELPPEARARVLTSGSSRQIGPDMVQPLALVLHELASNAVKHGALACDDGQVAVSWAEQRGQLFLVWQEGGAKVLSSAPEPRFGLRILVGIVEQQLGGKVAMSWSAQGFRAELTLPV